MLAKEIIRIVLYGIGLLSLCALIYFAGPLVAIGNWHPLENHMIRDITLILLVAAAASFAGFSFYRRKKSTEKLAEGIAGDSGPINDEPILKERMKDALATLKKAG